MSKKPLRSQARNIVLNVYQRILDEQGVFNTIIRRIVVEGRSNGGVFSTPGKKSKSEKKINLNIFDLELIRNKINKFYTVRKEIHIVMKLLQILQEEINFNGGRESLRLILKDVGFGKCQSKRIILMERHDMKIHRFKYLERMQKNREADDKLDVVFSDKTYIHGSYSVNKCWLNKYIAGPSKSILAGPRWIIVHAGGENGFVPNCCLVYRSKSTSANYHYDINKDNFTKCVTEKLIPNLTKPLIVMDKQNVASKNVNRPASNIKSLTEEASSQIGIDEWRKSCEHIIKIENLFIEQNRLIEECRRKGLP